MSPAEKIPHVQRVAQLLDSYELWLKRPLISRTTPEADARCLDAAPFVVVAHGTQDDPLLDYGNQAALRLWEMPADRFLGTPSRLTAEPVHRAERARLLERTRRDGFIDDYSGIRITAAGRRFRIHRAVVWNVLDAAGRPAGQAATFSEWTWLDEQADQKKDKEQPA